MRHASAGDRSAWVGEDRLRPLDARGWEQSLVIADLIVPMGCAALISSPAIRCIQTLKPLASKSGLHVEVDERLAEGADSGPFLSFLEACEDGTVLCSHGDLIPAALEVMVRHGLTIDEKVKKVRKGSVFAIERELGRFTTGRHWSRPGS